MAITNQDRVGKAMELLRSGLAPFEGFSSDDADRVLDSMARLLTAVSAPQADDVTRIELELRRLTCDEHVRSEKRKAGGSLIEAAVTGTLKPWREIVTPHTDVARRSSRPLAVHLGEEGCSATADGCRSTRCDRVDLGGR